ncbi:endopeptidase La [Roseiflexus castenholzii]|uniref:endopeptidase La n=1 Tax=Roseiflexus castenholzii TaxID=120962 RepID=UPI003C7A8ACA
MEDEHVSETTQPIQTLPLIPLDGVVVFPYTVVTVPLSEEIEAAAHAAMHEGQLALLVAYRRDAPSDAPLALRLHRIGVVARIEQIGRLPNGAHGMVVRGLVRAELCEQTQDRPYPRFRYIEHHDHTERTDELEQLMTEVHAAIDAVLELRPGIPQEIRNFVRSIDDPGHLADNTGYSPDYTFEERQDLLETLDVVERLRKVLAFYRKQLALMNIQARLRQEVQDAAARQQREFYLRQQLRAIQKELGEDTTEEDELAQLREKLEAANLTPAARKEADRELHRLSRMNSASPEYQMVRTYLEWMAELPWNKTTGAPIDIAHTRQVLDEDHYGLHAIKERILEYLAIQQRRQHLMKEERVREPILAFVGPPGVGKTSLGQSIARALGRQFARMSLGGVRDEAELRGFRRTYIGSQPGRLIQELRRAGTSDPVLLLDEIDKLGHDYRGDPAAALLEVLDPEQNDTFTDHYLNVPFDLSKVLFIATANTMDTVPPALRDRMEVIELSGYTGDEKVHIAQRHLIPKQLRANGLRPEEVIFEEEALRILIHDYTREAGVRNLERQIGAVLRKVTRRLVEEPSGAGSTPVRIDGAFVRQALGRPRFFNEARERIDQPGVATGLVWTPSGGDIVFVEASVVEGSRELRLTGQLGDVMRESAEAALTYVRSRAHTLGIDPHFFDRHAIHIHVPGGAVPKDGPSAGITMATALASAATGRLVRDDVAMTGEITLRGRVLPVGGVKEKVLGAHRAGISTIILPRRNEVDLDDLPSDVREALTFVPVETLDEVLAAALLPHPAATISNLFGATPQETHASEETPHASVTPGRA